MLNGRKDGKARKQPAKRRTPDDFAKDIAAKRASPVPPLSFPVPPADPADRDVGRRMEESARLVILEIDAMLRALDASPGAMKDPAGFGERLQMKATAFIELAQQKPPADDGFDIPPYLDRRVQR